MIEVASDSSRYRVGKMVADGDRYRVYLCEEADTGRQCLLQIAVSAEHNGILDRQAYVLRELKRISDELEREYAAVKTSPDTWLNYDLGFPGAVDSFVSAEQGRRRVNVLAFRNVDDARSLVPLDNLVSKDRLRVDLRTSVWIMGKLLKLLAFAHNEGIAAGLINGKNVMIEPKQHYVMVFDWSSAVMADAGTLSADDRRDDIMHAARTILIILGCDRTTGAVPDVTEEQRTYVDHLLGLAKGDTSNAEQARGQLYGLADSIWERRYHEFTTHPLMRG